jgi:hypothetical protein
MMDHHRRELQVVLWSFALVSLLLVSLLFFTRYAGMTGFATLPTTVNILPLIPHSCTVPLVAGWNLVSFYCVQGDYTLPANVTASIEERPFYIFGYIPGADPWKVYVNKIPDTFSDLPAYTINDLTFMKRTQGYWIYVESNMAITYVGALRPNITITLTPGWNLIGYPTNVAKNITDALSTINASITEVWMYDAASATWLSYRPDRAVNTLSVMVPSYGYWVNASATTTWRVDW